MTQMVWLASYPKSGNTWFRVLLSNYLGNRRVPADINNLMYTPIASARRLFDGESGVESSNLTYDEIDRYRPYVYRSIAKQVTNEELFFSKVHDAYRTLNDLIIFPADVSYGAIYLIRNPLDVAVSYANHNKSTHDNIVYEMNNESHSLVDTTYALRKQLRQQVRSWRSHVLSWIDQTDIPVHIIQYEHMLADTKGEFANALAFLGIDIEEDRLSRAVDFSRFEVLRQQEQEQGFREKITGVKSFFYKGRSGTWREVLRDDHVSTLIDYHRDVMMRFGYLTPDGQPTY